MKVKITVPRSTESNNELKRKYRNQHVYRKLRESWQRDIYILTKKQDVRDLRAHVDLQTRVKVSIHTLRSKLLDRDNLFGGIKPCLDAIKNLGFIVDDREEFCLLDVTQERNPGKFTFITIEGM